MTSIRPAAFYCIEIGVTDLAAAVRFYTCAWGLVLQAETEGGAVLRSPGSAHADVVLHRRDEPGLVELGLSLRSPGDLDILVERSLDAGAALIVAPSPDPFGRGQRAVLADPEGNHVALIASTDQTIATPAEADAGPTKLGHAVLWAKDRDALERFYEALGFKVSDRTAIGMSFLRCNTDHHSLALVTGTRSGLQHVAFEVASLDAMMRARARIEREASESIWGLGRHGPGNNIFAYYTDPAGNVVEIYTELERVDDHDDPLDAKYWDETHKGDIWGIAGPPPAAFRA